MRELSLHILDAIEHSIRAGASVVSVAIDEDPEQDLLQISVEDNGSGTNIPLEAVSKVPSAVPLERGLDIFRAAAEQAHGDFLVSRSRLGGASIKAEMRLSRLDRRPLGDLAATLSSVVCTNPGLDLWCRFSAGNDQCEIRVSDLAAQCAVHEQGGLALARRVSEKINQWLVVRQTAVDAEDKMGQVDKGFPSQLSPASSLRPQPLTTDHSN